MIGFPFDSHVTYDEEGSPIYDRAISSAPYRKLLRELFSTGIMPTNSENMQVAAGEGMSVIVRPGFAVVEGCLKLEEETRILALQAADSTLDRIDTVVLRLDSNDSARVCDFYIVQGVPSLVPVHPDLTRAGSIYEIALADVLVTKQSSVISDSKITDTRFDPERCGVVSSVSEFDTSALDQQIRAWSQEQQEEFSAWVESIKSILDESTAGHLQNQIDELRESAGGVKDLIGGEYEAGKTYKRGEIAVSDGKVWKSKIDNNAGNTPAAGSYWEETTIAKESGNLGGLVLGYDGDGNGGYYKADGSFSPFSSGDVSVVELPHPISGTNGNRSVVINEDYDLVFVCMDYVHANFNKVDINGEQFSRVPVAQPNDYWGDIFYYNNFKAGNTINIKCYSENAIYGIKFPKKINNCDIDLLYQVRSGTPSAITLSKDYDCVFAFGSRLRYCYFSNISISRQICVLGKAPNDGSQPGAVCVIKKGKKNEVAMLMSPDTTGYGKIIIGINTK